MFREAPRDIAYGDHSVPEAKAGRLLRSAGLTGFEQNAPIVVRGRRFVADCPGGHRDLRRNREIRRPDRR